MKKILSVILSLIILAFPFVSGVTAVGEEAKKPVFSLSVSNKTDSSLSVSINLESGSFNSCDILFSCKGLTATKISLGSGYRNFRDSLEEEGLSAPIYSSNPGVVPEGHSNISMASAEMAYNEVGSMFIVTLTINDPEEYSFGISFLSMELETSSGIVSLTPDSPKAISVHTHSYSLSSTTNATCTAAGEKIYTCPCGDSYKEPISAKGHTEGVWKTVTNPTCTKDGSREIRCTECSSLLKTDVIPAKGHTPGNPVIQKQATTEEDGLEIVKCTVCKEVIDVRVIPKIQKGVTDVTLSQSKMDINFKSSATITANVTSSGDTDYEVVFTSKNTSVATVDQNGLIIAKKTGTTTIVCDVTDNYGNHFSKECQVTVKYTFIQKIIVYVLFGWIWYI